jgi:hypothetical protein
MPGGFILFSPSNNPYEGCENICFFCCCFLLLNLNAQTETAIATRRAILYSDSMLTAFRYNNLNEYIEMSYPGVIKYYGGKKNYMEYIQRARLINNSALEEQPEKIQVVQMENDTREWQCVVQKTCATMIDGKRAIIISYMVGQSKNEGRDWKFFDVALNSPGNIIYIMPDIFDTLDIPLRQIVFEKSGLAKKQ